jgi:hypothetical protein
MLIIIFMKYVNFYDLLAESPMTQMDSWEMYSVSSFDSASECQRAALPRSSSVKVD